MKTTNDTPEPEDHNITSSSTGSTINYGTSYTTWSNAYICSRCSQWVSSYGYHNCIQPSITTTTSYTWSQCEYCSGINHSGAKRCPRVKSIEYHEDGSIRKIKFHKP